MRSMRAVTGMSGLAVVTTILLVSQFIAGTPGLVVY
jgi:hypothetical protein